MEKNCSNYIKTNNNHKQKNTNIQGLKRTKFKPVRNENCYIYNIMTTMYQKLRDHHLQIHAIHADFHVGNIFHLRYHAHA